MDLSRVFSVTTRGTPFSTFVISETLWQENLALLVSVSISFFEYFLYKNHDFISQIFYENFFLSSIYDLASELGPKQQISFYDLDVKNNREYTDACQLS